MITAAYLLTVAVSLAGLARTLHPHARYRCMTAPSAPTPQYGAPYLPITSRTEDPTMTEPTTYQATLSRGPHGHWRLFVVLPGRVADWPSEEFTGEAIPTVYARAAVLEELGYETVDDEWHWTEDTAHDGSVALLAGHTVRRIR